MLFSSKENREWSTFKVSRKDLPRGTSVMVSRDNETWRLKRYSGENTCYSLCGFGITVDWDYIIPADRFNFKDWSFDEADNYGTAYKE